MNENNQSHTTAFYFLAWASFIIASLSMLIGIALLPFEIWVKGFLGLGYLFTVTTCLTLAKIIRDKHEIAQLIKQVQETADNELLNSKQELLNVLQKLQ